MKVERVISLFDKKTEDLIEELNVDHIDFQILKSIFNPPQEDYLMYNPYRITKEHAYLLKNYIEFDFDKYIYQLDCFRID